ncbi:MULTISPECIES: hypothetical protein [unclassified Mesorhizobium]|uniref:hypothetical protein n=1 Tax=unclassified Mesorhizobium TaxID=325217 RepID=UPI000FDB7D15|nr:MULTISPECIES: hypothetical protein [unclassified Mesorhizobium]TGQ16379.1 hypothetical protein EN862_002450 [Mesorhizobium sp. M2E.F.Ca.ET.219.01.1.1]TGT77524.1 hypothetical protein EN809_008110 [Mesorhizobium sp. M2E.F.Ca.ET.166.01.1.1]TGW03633.1 hypothetical protein EN797_008110 [Mesorhizobium sp. M2E.F.Ca.ET.154.01.1.1]
MYSLVKRALVPPLSELERENTLAEFAARGRRDGWRRRQAACLLADDYGYKRGWYRSRATFCLGQLERRSNQTRRGEQAGVIEYGALIDHPTWYRAGGRPAAIVAQPYYVNERLLAELRRRYLLRVEVDDSYPPWKGSAILVMTPDDEQIAALDAEAARLQGLYGKGSVRDWCDHLRGRRLLLMPRIGPAPGFGSWTAPTAPKKEITA